MHKNAVAMYIQTSRDNGAMNENSPGGSLFGLAYKILIPTENHRGEKNIKIPNSIII